MQNYSNATIDREPLGKGVFQPSRAPIAQEMKARLTLGGGKQRTATSSRH
jgi:hypothetical protein